jgi:hypothetical protein
MKRTRNFRVSSYKTWFKNPRHYERKTYLIRDHFDIVQRADAILVLNLKKKETDGYIGGNTLMKMAIAFNYKKPIFIFDNISEDSPLKEEILGVNPVFIDGDLNKIPTRLKKKYKKT